MSRLPKTTLVAELCAGGAFVSLWACSLKLEALALHASEDEDIRRVMQSVFANLMEPVCKQTQLKKPHLVTSEDWTFSARDLDKITAHHGGVILCIDPFFSGLERLWGTVFCFVLVFLFFSESIHKTASTLLYPLSSHLPGLENRTSFCCE